MVTLKEQSKVEVGRIIGYNVFEVNDMEPVKKATTVEEIIGLIDRLSEKEKAEILKYLLGQKLAVERYERTIWDDLDDEEVDRVYGELYHKLR